MFWLLLFIVIIALTYRKVLESHRYWTKKGVAQGNPLFFVGDSWRTFLHKMSVPENVVHLYNLRPEARCCGTYQLLQPILILRDPDLIKQVMVRDFDHFVNHRGFIPETHDPIFSTNLFILPGDKWRQVRSTLNPAFSSNKLKVMFSAIEQKAQKFTQHFLEKNKELVILEFKDAFGKYCSDVMTVTSFGIDCNSLEDPANEVYQMARNACQLTGVKKTAIFLGYSLVPQLCKTLGFSYFSQEVSAFFTKLVRENISSREKLGVSRPDFINLLMEARKQNNSPSQQIKITEEVITDQAFILFLGSFEPVSSLMGFMSYELALNPEVQNKLRQEIIETSEQCDGQLNFTALANMKYMGMVISETMRKWPFAIAIDRVCNKEYTIQPKEPNEKPIILEKGTVVIAPIFGLHRDPQYFPEPDSFDPERFSDKNKAKINPYTYMPFGTGPRNCIGNRFAILKTKALFFYLLMNFEIVPVEKTQIPVRLNKKSLNLMVEDGFWLGLKRIV